MQAFLDLNLARFRRDGTIIAYVEVSNIADRCLMKEATKRHVVHDGHTVVASGSKEIQPFEKLYCFLNINLLRT